jgi:plastocyanin
MFSKTDIGSGKIATTLVVMALVAACGGSGGNPTSPSSTTQPNTVTLTSSGLQPRDLRVAVGTQVRFVNNDTRPHEIQSNPHPTHGDCAEISELSTLQPGQSALTRAVTREIACGYHDNLDDTNRSWRGQIIVGGASAISEGGLYNY